MIKSITSLAGTRVLASVCQGFMLYLLTQSLGPAVFGTFATVLAAAAIAGITFGLGTSTLALRVKAVDNPYNVASGILALRIPTALLAAASTYYFVTIAMGIHDGLLLVVALTLATADSTSEVVESVLFGLQRVRRAQLAMVTRRVVALLGVFLGLMQGNVLVGLGVSALLILLGSPIWLARLTGKPAGPLRIMRLSVGFWGATLLGKAQTLDVVIASAVCTPVVAGIYAGASRLTSPLNMVTSASLSILTPSLANQRNSQERYASFMRGRRLLIIVGGCLFVMSPIVAAGVLVVLGEEYRGVFWPTVLLTIATAVSAVTQGHTSYYFAAGKAAFVTKIRIAVVPISLLLAIPLGFNWGAVGVAGAMMLSQLAQVGIFEVYLLKVKKNFVRQPLEDAQDLSALEGL